MDNKPDLKYWLSQDKRFSSDFFYWLVEQAPYSIQLFAMNGDAVYVNESWKNFWAALSREAVAGYNILKETQVKEVGIFSYIKRSFEGEYVEIPPFFYDVSKINREGTSRWLAASMYPLKDSAGKQFGVALFHFDVTKQKELEAKISEYAKELEARVKERTRELDKKISELERMNKFMVGRELKMIELKRELKNLQEKFNSSSLK